MFQEDLYVVSEWIWWRNLTSALVRNCVFPFQVVRSCDLDVIVLGNDQYASYAVGSKHCVFLFTSPYNNRHAKAAQGPHPQFNSAFASQFIIGKKAVTMRGTIQLIYLLCRSWAGRQSGGIRSW
jgi:hypothetical protein